MFTVKEVASRKAGGRNMLNELIRKGNKTVHRYMMGYGYQLYGCEETETGYRAEYYKTHAGVTIATVFIEFNKKWRCTRVSNSKGV